MGKLTLEFVQNDYEELKRNAYRAYKKNNVTDAIKFIKAATGIAYHINFRFTDDDLEELIVSIAKDICESPIFAPINNRIVFYDQFGLDNKGLTQQYLDALTRLNYEVLYIIDSLDLSRSNEIRSFVESQSNADIHVVDSSLDDISKLNSIVDKIATYRPERAFLHLSPWGVAGIGAFTLLSSVERYLINLTDHAYWLGKCSADYYIEFRDFGYSLSMKARNIADDKLLGLPYYPIVVQGTFKGFPINTEGKVIIFSGGAYYKIYGENDLYFELVKRIVCENPNVVFFYAGYGDSTPFESFIENNKLGDRVCLLGHRNDINEVFKHCDIYLSTFPINGALMCQYAVINGKIPVGYSTKDLSHTFIDTYFQVSDHVKFTYTELEEFHQEVNRLVEDKEYRDIKCQYLKDKIPNADQFAENLRNIIETKKGVPLRTVDFDVNRMTVVHLNKENEYLSSYSLIKFSHLGLTYFRYEWKSAIRATFNILIQNRDILMRKLKLNIRS